MADSAGGAPSRPGPAWFATYRVQLQPGFGFEEASTVVAYLADLGISHLYCSPFLQAVRGSTHGYDVVDHSRLSDDLGGEAGYAVLAQALNEAGLGEVADIVPNHMAIAEEANRWWWDVLENGPDSRYASYFDIDWDSSDSHLAGKVLAPILGDHYGRVLGSGQLAVARAEESLVVTYHDHRLPVAPGSLEQLGDGEGADEILSRVNGDQDQLHDLLELQHYRLAFWKVASHEPAYRRFFDVNGLVGLRVERPEVFEQTHALVLDLVATGHVHGVRIDHPDGLRDPHTYLSRLAQATGGVPLFVEKILAPGEDLPPWPVAGTTGYEFLNSVSSLFVDPDGEAALEDTYEKFNGGVEVADDLVYEAKLAVMSTVLASDVERLTAHLAQVCASDRAYRDFPRSEIHQVLEQGLAAFDVYRTYVSPGQEIRPEDEARVNEAMAVAAAWRPDLDPELFGLLGQVLLSQRHEPDALEVAVRFQQVCAAVTAKGVEDTAMYRYHRLVAMNEVGAEIGSFASSIDDFHRAMAKAATERPLSLLASSTHDTKRGEDVRARLRLLAEMPEEWSREVEAWSAMARPHLHASPVGRLPDANAEYLLYQTLVGAWPIEVDRARDYMRKATREAKHWTSWADPDAEYETALDDFVEGVMGDASLMAEIGRFTSRIETAGWISSLAQTLVKLTAPGTPDIYQGAELWDLNLVDPDNRRAVDFEARRRLLARVKPGTAAQAWADAASGAPKLFLVHRTLQLRRRLSPVLDGGASYEPLAGTGPGAEHVVGFVRGGCVAVVVPRLALKLAGRGGWGETTLVLAPGRWTDELTGVAHAGGEIPMADLLAEFPVALLVRS